MKIINATQMIRANHILIKINFAFIQNTKTRDKQTLIDTDATNTDKDTYNMLCE